LAVVLKRKSLAILVIVVLLLSVGATLYIFMKVETEEFVPDEGEAGLGLTIGEWGCRWDSDCVGQWVECDEDVSHKPSKQRCVYYQCPTGQVLSKDKINCSTPVKCGQTGCYDNNSCLDDNNMCVSGKCQLKSCPDGQVMSSDKCSCESPESDPTCGDGKLNVSGEECEMGNPSGVSCTWDECNQVTCKCPVPKCGDGKLNVTGEECEANNPSGVMCLWSECNQSTCKCPDEEQEQDQQQPTQIPVSDGDELPETGIFDTQDEFTIFYLAFFVSGGVLILSYVLESPKRKYENEVIDRFEG